MKPSIHWWMGSFRFVSFQLPLLAIVGVSGDHHFIVLYSSSSSLVDPVGTSSVVAWCGIWCGSKPLSIEYRRSHFIPCCMHACMPCLFRLARLTSPLLIEERYPGTGRSGVDPAPLLYGIWCALLSAKKEKPEREASKQASNKQTKSAMLSIE